MTETPTILDLLARGVDVLSDAKVANPRLDAELLLCHALGVSKEYLHRELTMKVGARAVHEYETLVERRRRRCPVSYIVGEREFYSIPFHVDPRVLIPRQETELLVEAALSRARPWMKIADVGTGSGCIACALARELPSCSIVATDASQAALEVALGNVERLGLDDRIRLVRADLLPADEGPFHMIVSNPPYVAESSWDHLMPEVKEFEPKEALVPGPDGLEMYPRLARAAKESLVAGGFLIVEVGIGQADAVEAIFETAGLRPVDVIDDFARIPRAVLATTGPE